MRSCDETYIKMYRKIFDNGIWKNLIELRLFIWLIGHAVFDKPKYYDDIKVSRGQYLRSYRKLSVDLEYIENNAVKQYPPKTIQRAATKLVKGGMILTEDTKLATLFTVLNYDKYQPKHEINEIFENKEEQEEIRLVTGHDTCLPQIRHNNKNENNENNKYSTNSDEFMLSSLLLSLIKQRRSNFKEPNIQKWCEQIDKLIRLDRQSPREIDQVIRWSQKNEFWQNNILSTDKLRKQYEKLAMQMEADLKKTSRDEFSRHFDINTAESDRILI